MFVPGKSFQPSLMFGGKDIGLDWKSLKGTNALAYYENALLMTINLFMACTIDGWTDGQVYRYRQRDKQMDKWTSV